jgi:hypothetical protein
MKLLDPPADVVPFALRAMKMEMGAVFTHVGLPERLLRAIGQGAKLTCDLSED